MDRRTRATRLIGECRRRGRWSAWSACRSPPSRCIGCSVPATGYGGTPKIGLAAAPGGERRRPSGCASMPIPIPACRGRSPRTRLEVTLPLGEEQVAFYHAHQQGATAGDRDGAVQRDAGESRRSISTRPPASASTSRRWRPGRAWSFPVSFWVDPAIRDRSEHGDVQGDHAVLYVLPLAGGCREDRRAGQGRAACRADVGSGACGKPKAN